MLLILSSRTDIHAEAAACALDQEGESCVILRQEDYPESVAISVDPAGETTISLPSGRQLPLSSFRAVWNRRSANPHPPTFLSPRDQDLSYRASKRFLEWFNLSKPRDQLWINDPGKALEAANKVAQLRIARDVGFIVPETIITNHPGDARRFVGAGPTIAKPLLPMFWDESSYRVATAMLVTSAQMANDRAISACPMIYQRHVIKRCDIRVVVFGSEIVAARIDSQRSDSTKVDFRAGDYFSMAVAPFEVDQLTRKRILDFMAASGLLHASFDLVISEDDEIIFLEVNQQGQMTWIEDRNPSIRILDRLCGFLRAPSIDYRWDGVEKFPFEKFRELKALPEPMPAK